MSCVTYTGSISSNNTIYQRLQIPINVGESITQFVEAAKKIFKSNDALWVESCKHCSNNFEDLTYNDLMTTLWYDLFPGEKLIEPYEGAVDEYNGFLGKLLPPEIDFDLENELNEING